MKPAPTTRDLPGQSLMFREPKLAELQSQIAGLVAALRLCLPYVPIDGDDERDAREAAEDAMRRAGEP